LQAVLLALLRALLLELLELLESQQRRVRLPLVQDRLAQLRTLLSPTRLPL
jgi:hypothetical protein